MEGPFLIPITFFLSTAAVFIVWLTLRYRERTAMVEKGLSAEDIKTIYARNIKRDPLSSLKWGILFVAIGIAAVIIGILESLHVDEGGLMIGILAVFIGAGLLLFYRIASQKNRLEQQSA
jgi:hypothetical protein